MLLRGNFGMHRKAIVAKGNLSSFVLVDIGKEEYIKGGST
jgi:hypothetical protein